MDLLRGGVGDSVRAEDAVLGSTSGCFRLHTPPSSTLSSSLPLHSSSLSSSILTLAAVATVFSRARGIVWFGFIIARINTSTALGV